MKKTFWSILFAMLLCEPSIGVTVAGQQAESVCKDYWVASEYFCTAKESGATVHYYRQSLDAEFITYARRWRVMGGGWGTRNLRVMKNGKCVGRLKRIPMEKGTVIMLANGSEVEPRHRLSIKGKTLSSSRSLRSRCCETIIRRRSIRRMP